MKDVEHQHQAALVEWFRLQYPKLRPYLFAIPNGGARHIAVASKLKSEGVLAGVADLMLAVPKNGFHGMFIEMKAPKGKLSEHQKQWMGEICLMGYRSIVCFGVDGAKQEIKNYLSGALDEEPPKTEW